MSVIPFLGPIESRFVWSKADDWIMGEYGKIATYLCTVYLIVIFVGTRWMRSKPAFYLRRPLTMWNTGLAVFSIIGFLTEVPLLVENITMNGFYQSVCVDWVHNNNRAAHASLWCLLFLLSKSIELGDTLFIILRKTPLTFLHCYHHITVLLYSAWFNSPHSPALTNWFGTTNYFIHSLMYSYFTFKAAGCRVPKILAQAITILQLAQFVLGVLTTSMAYVYKMNGTPCDSSYAFLHVGLLIYGSYFILFLNFFLQRYVFNKK